VKRPRRVFSATLPYLQSVISQLSQKKKKRSFQRRKRKEALQLSDRLSALVFAVSEREKEKKEKGIENGKEKWRTSVSNPCRAWPEEEGGGGRKRVAKGNKKRCENVLERGRNLRKKKKRESRKKKGGGGRGGDALPSIAPLFRWHQTAGPE